MPIAAVIAGDLTVLLDSLWSASLALSEGVRRQRTKADCEVSVAAGADAVALAAADWKSLEADGAATTPFQAHAVASSVAEAHWRRGETPRVVVVRDAGRPMVVLPTVVTRFSGVATLRFLGDPLIQYGDALVARDATERHLDTAWDAAADPAVVRFAFLRKVRADARIAPLLARRTAVVADHRAPYVDPHRPPVAKARDQRELRRFRRRLQDIGALRFSVLAGTEALPHLREAIELKRAWLAERGMPSGVIGDADWESAVEALARAPASPLRIARLSVGERTAAVEIGIVCGARWCAFLGALDQEFAKSGPGHVQMAETIAHCRDAGLSVYDLLAPADVYKDGLAHDAVDVRDHAVALTAAGWAGMIAATALPAAKRLAARMPAGLLRAVMASRSR